MSRHETTDRDDRPEAKERQRQPSGSGIAPTTPLPHRDERERDEHGRVENPERDSDRVHAVAPLGLSGIVRTPEQCCGLSPLLGIQATMPA